MHSNGAVTGAFSRLFNDEGHSETTLNQKQDNLRKEYFDFIDNNPGAPVPVSNNDFQNVILALEVQKANDLELSTFNNLDGIKFELEQADGFFFEESFRSQKFIIEGYRNNNGQGFNGSTINYFVVGTRFASLNSSIFGRAALSGAVIKHNFGDLRRGGSPSYMAHNRRQALDTGQYWSGVGFNAFRDQ